MNDGFVDNIGIKNTSEQ